MSFDNIWKYEQLMPRVPMEDRISLGEGITPLVKSRVIGASVGLPNLYFKLELLNPTGSYKDRFASAFTSIMKSRRQPFCISTSSGNTGAALAAYCAAAQIKCLIAIVDGAPQAKIRQMQLYGAATCMIKGFGKDPLITTEIFEMLNAFAGSIQLPLPISAYRYCVEGMKGVQTLSYELLEQMNGKPFHIFSPAGGGGLTLAIARGAMDYSKHLPLPAVHCVQPEGNNTIAGPLRNQKDHAEKIQASTTVISGLQVPNVLDGDEVIAACRITSGNGYTVTDAAVFECQQKLAKQEGIFCEPAGAVSLAGALTALQKKEISKNDQIVCLVTGSGFKDMVSVDSNFDIPALEITDSRSFNTIIRQQYEKLSL